MGCNTESPDDSANFLSFLQALRADPAGHNITVSAAVGLTPFAGMSDVSAFASVLDYIEIMDYDVWGSWSKYVGPNAPLNDSCAQSRYQMGSAVSAVKAWTAAGFPANQIVLGVASYGHGFFVSPNDAFAPGSTTQLVAYPPLQNTTALQGDSWDTYSPSAAISVETIPTVVTRACSTSGDLFRKDFSWETVLSRLASRIDMTTALRRSVR